MKGPEIRTGYLHHEINIKKDTLSRICRSTQSRIEIFGKSRLTATNYLIISDWRYCSLDNGLIQPNVVESSSEKIRCKVLDDAILKRKHMGYGIETGLPSLTEKDRDSLVGIECEHDFLHCPLPGMLIQLIYLKFSSR